MTTTTHDVSTGDGPIAGPEVEETDSPELHSAPEPFLSGRVRRAMSATFAVLCALALVALLLELLVLKPRYDDAVAARTSRTQAVQAARAFMAQFNTYDYRHMDDYRQSMKDLLSTKAESDFEQAFTATSKAVTQKRLRSTGEVLASGVASADADSASVLVVGDADVKSTDGELARHFRWQVALVKVDGDWLVDDFDAVT